MIFHHDDAYVVSLILGKHRFKDHIVVVRKYFFKFILVDWGVLPNQ